MAHRLTRRLASWYLAGKLVLVSWPAGGLAANACEHLPCIAEALTKVVSQGKVRYKVRYLA